MSQQRMIMIMMMIAHYFFIFITCCRLRRRCSRGIRFLWISFVTRSRVNVGKILRQSVDLYNTKEQRRGGDIARPTNNQPTTLKSIFSAVLVLRSNHQLVDHMSMDLPWQKMIRIKVLEQVNDAEIIEVWAPRLRNLHVRGERREKNREGLEGLRWGISWSFRKLKKICKYYTIVIIGNFFAICWWVWNYKGRTVVRAPS